MKELWLTPDLSMDEGFYRIRCDDQGKLLVSGTFTPTGTSNVDVVNTPTVEVTNTPTVNVVGTVTITKAGSTYTHLASAGTTTIRSGSGILRRVSVNKSSLASSVTLYDNTSGSGTKIAVIDSGSTNTLEYNCSFSTGLTAVLAGGPDVTIIWD